VGLDAKVDRGEKAFEEFEHGWALRRVTRLLEAPKSVKGTQAMTTVSVSKAMEGVDCHFTAPGHLGQRWPRQPARRRRSRHDAARRKAQELDVNLRSLRAADPAAGSGG